MTDRPAMPEQIATHIREADIAVRALADSVVSVDELVAKTRDVIVESRRLIDQADKLLSR